jgi:predicted nucleic acid-binding protein
VSLPNSTPKPRVFLDSSALFAAILSAAGGARLILHLAEGGAVEVVISAHVLAEVENALRRKVPEALGYLALLLDRANCQIVTNPPTEQVRAWEELVSYLPDAAVLAAAIGVQADYLVTLDRRHLLENPRLAASPPLPIGTLGDFVAWLRQQFAAG